MLRASTPAQLLLVAVCGCGSPFLELAGDAGGAYFEIQPEEEVAFGLASPNGSPVTQEAWLRTYGSGNVAVESVSLDQDARGVFTLAFDPTPCLLSGEDEIPVEFRFHPDDSDQYSGRVSFVVRVDGSERVLTRRLTGTGCSDQDGDGQCAGASQPDWDGAGWEDDSGGW
jgi:hypothetical protein